MLDAIAHPRSDARAVVAPTIDQARACLTQYFGYGDFRPPQIGAVESVISGRDTLIVLPTGGGKSLCYQVPALMRPGLTVVISPLISLMKDQVDALERRGIEAAFVNSTLGPAAVAERLARADRGTLRMLYLAPERIESPGMIERLRRIGVALLAVDEAHCISEWGHDFRPSYRRLGRVRRDVGDPQTVALTATATPDVRADIMRQLELRDARVVVAGFDRTNLTYHVVSVRTQRDKDRAACQWLRHIDGTAIVYTPTRKAVERVTSVLVQSRIQAVAYHGGLDESLRQRAQDAFMNQRSRVIVATSAFGMGIDKPDVRLVVHHAMPGTLESYYQEAGRAGRDGLASTCVLLHMFPDRFTHEHFIESAHPDRRVIETVWQLLRFRADADGYVPGSPASLAAQLPRSIGEARIDGALRVLSTSGALTRIPDTRGRAFIRLMATPARIATELVGARDRDRQLLRALWRTGRDALRGGTDVDLDGLPRALGGMSEIVPALQRLETEQFLCWQGIGGGIRLDPRHGDDRWLPVDWTSMMRKRKADLARLDAMQGYAHCRTCRRAFVLHYFGDTVSGNSCNGCDRCLGCTGHMYPPGTLKRHFA